MRVRGLSVGRKRGVVAVQVLVTMSLMLGMAALTVDVGHIYNARFDMQSAVDASALAGASGLLTSPGAVVTRAMSHAPENRVANVAVSPDELDVTIGFWSGSAQRFVPSTGLEGVAPNAVRVVGTRERLPLFFAPILGVHTSSAERAATAAYGASRCAGIWGLEGITGDGSISTDSYDIGNGAYGAGNIFANGDICSNRDIYLAGSVNIFGDAMYGNGYSLTADGSSYNVWGAVDENCCNEVVPAFDMADAAVNNDNATMPLTDIRDRDPFAGTQWDLIGVTGTDTLTLDGGTYYLTSALIEGQTRIFITGPTTLYISGDASFGGGGIINVTEDPSNLVIYATSPTLLIRGGAGFHGVVIAPNSTVQLVGDSDFYGLIMAGILDVDGNANIHVEESLIPQFFGGTTEGLTLVQ